MTYLAAIFFFLFSKGPGRPNRNNNKKEITRKKITAVTTCICPGCVAQDYLHRFEQLPGLCVRVVGTTRLRYKIILVIPTPGITNAPGVHHCVLIIFC